MITKYYNIMDRRTFLKSASMKGTAIVTASAVGTEMLHAAESIGGSDVASGKQNLQKRNGYRKIYKSL